MHVDVFVAFHVEAPFFQLGNRSGALPARGDRAHLDDRAARASSFPAPADPEAMLAFVYGPRWRVPDPSFHFADPLGGRAPARRLAAGLPRASSRAGTATGPPRTPARCHTGVVLRALGRARGCRWSTPVADLGCGNGRDAWFFAKRRREVRSFDCSPEARVRTRRLLRRKGAPHDVRRLQLNELRTVLAEGLLLRGSTLYARQLLDSVDDEARRNLWRLARLAGGEVFVEFASGRARPPDVPGLQRALDADSVVAEAAAAGGRLLEREDIDGTDLNDRPGLPVSRLQLDFTEDHDE